MHDKFAQAVFDTAESEPSKVRYKGRLLVTLPMPEPLSPSRGAAELAGPRRGRAGAGLRPRRGL